MNPFARPSMCLIAAAALAACSGTGTTAPSVPIVPSAFIPRVVQVTAEDRAAARSVSHFSYHIFPVSSRRLARLPNKTKIIYPADLRYYGGPLMKTAAEHNIYVNCKSKDEKCWGDPEGFLKDLAESKLIKLLTQYTNAGPDAYTFADGTPVAFAAYSKYYYFTDLLSILHSVAKSLGTGYTNEYHIFLPKGVDTCFDGTTICYSPDVPSTFNLCAYHGLAAFSDIGPTVFSVEPYQDVSLCGVYSNLPKYHTLTNSTDSVLAHEMFESITDPRLEYKIVHGHVVGTVGWYNFAYGDEIGDLCYAFPISQTIGKTKYFIQTMYSDKYHACANGP
jgi:hypothetical protein